MQAEDMKTCMASSRIYRAAERCGRPRGPRAASYAHAGLGRAPCGRRACRQRRGASGGGGNTHKLQAGSGKLASAFSCITEISRPEQATAGPAHEGAGAALQRWQGRPRRMSGHPNPAAFPAASYPLQLHARIVKPELWTFLPTSCAPSCSTSFLWGRLSRCKRWHAAGGPCTRSPMPGRLHWRPSRPSRSAGTLLPCSQPLKRLG